MTIRFWNVAGGTRILALGATLSLAPWALAAQVPDSLASPQEVTLQPGDLLRVQIWREETLSGDFLVNERGLVVLPMLGPIEVAGRPVPALRDSLLAAYSTQLRNPSINIVPLRRVYVLGEVGSPGLYPVDPTITLAGVIALAEGATPSGDLRNIQISRNGEVIQESVQAGTTLTAADVRSGDQVFVGRRSWFERNSTFLVSLLVSVPGIIASILALR